MIFLYFFFFSNSYAKFLLLWIGLLDEKKAFLHTTEIVISLISIEIIFQTTKNYEELIN